jgi:hypothetical protein
MITYSRGSHMPRSCGFREASHTGDLGAFRISLPDSACVRGTADKL